METQNLTPESKNGITKHCNENCLKLEATHKHKHIDAHFQLLNVCENDSWKGLIIDNTSGNKKPKNYTVQNGYKDQWDKII